MEVDPTFSDFVQEDGHILVELDQMLYGLRESPEPILLEQDNRSTLINMESKYGSFKHTKHIDRHYFITLFEAGQVRTAWVASVDLAADLLSKSVSKTVVG